MTKGRVLMEQLSVKKFFLMTFASLVVFSHGKAVLAAPDASDASSEWNYTGQTGPLHWGELSNQYRLCDHGRQQSPIDIDAVSNLSADPINFHYQPSKLTLKHDAHNLTIEFPDNTDNHIDVDSDTFKLVNIHFHTPSEHVIRGKHYPMEVHFVHKDNEGHYAVVGILMDESNQNSVLSTIFNLNLPEMGQTLTYSKTRIDPNKLLPKQQSYYSYMGSFTTPPCTEDVTWFVMKKPMSVSPAQKNMFKTKVSKYNARPIQELRDRQVRDVQVG